ncbi:MAG: outer membrane beta-barrel protein [Bacteroidetes bacterium]|nr:outer membrane beta-barrel protein [Bacteroidota bacterium]
MKRTIIINLICLFAICTASAQNNDSIPKTRSHYTLAIGLGWSHYFSNMDLVPARNVQKDFIGTSLRFMWEPEYRLSLGLETGLYRIFRVDSVLTSEYTMDARMYMVPLLLVIRMRIVDNFYLSIAPGLAVQFSQISGIGDKISSTQYSFANFEACASYLYPLNKHMEVGGEARFFYIGKTNDYIMSLNAVFAVKL